jgi:hypothetical protein
MKSLSEQEENKSNREQKETTPRHGTSLSQGGQHVVGG